MSELASRLAPPPKRAPQGRARRPDASSKGGVRTIPKEPLPQKDFCSSGVLNSFRETISESQGDLLGTEGWTKSSLLGGMCPSRQQLVFDLLSHQGKLEKGLSSSDPHPAGSAQYPDQHGQCRLTPWPKGTTGPSLCRVHRQLGALQGAWRGKQEQLARPAQTRLHGERLSGEQG